MHVTQAGTQVKSGPISVKAVEDIEPWHYYDTLREQGPLVWDELMKAWIILDFENCAHVEINEDKFRNAYVGVSPIVVQVKGGGANITLSSGEQHDKIRRFHLKLFTPPLSAGALYGITRQVVIELAEASGIKVSEPNLTRYDLFNADECFLTGTGAELMPIVKIDGRVIGNGKPGTITKKLVREYHSLTKASGEPIYE